AALLDQRDLDETAGLGSGQPEVSAFNSCQGFGLFPTDGPVDWDLSGAATNHHLSDDVDVDWTFLGIDPSWVCTSTDPLIALHGWDDWTPLLETGSLDTSIVVGATTGSTELVLLRETEPTVEELRQHHVLHAPRPVSFVILGACLENPNVITLGEKNTFSVALLATEDFDVSEVDLSSLRFHRARPVSTTMRDVNGDGRLDLVIQFRAS